MAAFEPYLRCRWAEGCENAAQRWRELCQQGFRGGRTTVKDFVRRRRVERAGPDKPPTVQPVRRYGPHETCWLLLRPVGKLSVQESAYLQRLYGVCPHVALAEAFTEKFQAVLASRDVSDLYACLHGAEQSGIPELRAVCCTATFKNRPVSASNPI